MRSEGSGWVYQPPWVWVCGGGPLGGGGGGGGAIGPWALSGSVGSSGITGLKLSLVMRLMAKILHESRTTRLNKHPAPDSRS